MAKEKTYMPQTSAGLIRYYDEEGGIKIPPQAVVWVTFMFIGFVAVLKYLI